MADLVIRKKDIENFGRKIMKEVYKFLNDDYILTFEEMKVEKNKLEKYLVNFYLRMIYEIDVFKFEKDKYDNYIKELEDESKYNNYLKELVAKIKDESLDINLIFDVLDRIKLDFEIDEDIYDKKKAFIYFYSVYEFYDAYLKE